MFICLTAALFNVSQHPVIWINYKNSQGRKYKNTNLMWIHLASYYASSTLNRTQEITVTLQIYDEWTKNTLNITVQGLYLLSALDFWAVFCKTTSVLPIEQWKEGGAPATVNIHKSLLTQEINVFNPAMGAQSFCMQRGRESESWPRLTWERCTLFPVWSGN